MNKDLMQKILIYLLIFTICSLLIAAGLSHLVLKPGVPMPEIDHTEGVVVLQENNTTNVVVVSEIGKIILILLFAGLFIILMIKADFKAMVSLLPLFLFIILGILVIVLIIIFIFPDITIADTVESVVPPEIPDEEQGGLLPGEILVIFYVFTGIILTGLIVFLIIKIFLVKKEKNRMLQMIELEARNARNAIHDGEDLRNVIIKSYHNMCRALKEGQDIERGSSMTVVEFKRKIEETGAPNNSIDDLTSLFEAVRYGNWEPEVNDEKKAIQCFDNIIRYFQTETERKDHEKK